MKRLKTDLFRPHAFGEDYQHSVDFQTQTISHIQVKELLMNYHVEIYKDVFGLIHFGNVWQVVST